MTILTVPSRHLTTQLVFSTIKRHTFSMSDCFSMGFKPAVQEKRSGWPFSVASRFLWPYEPRYLVGNEDGPLMAAFFVEIVQIDQEKPYWLELCVGWVVHLVCVCRWYREGWCPSNNLAIEMGFWPFGSIEQIWMILYILYIYIYKHIIHLQ